MWFVSHDQCLTRGIPWKFIFTKSYCPTYLQKSLLCKYYWTSIHTQRLCCDKHTLSALWNGGFFSFWEVSNEPTCMWVESHLGQWVSSELSGVCREGPTVYSRCMALAFVHVNFHWFAFIFKVLQQGWVCSWHPTYLWQLPDVQWRWFRGVWVCVHFVITVLDINVLKPHTICFYLYM